MKIGMRTPSAEKMVRARTTGRVKRMVKKSYNPIYGRKGVGYLKDPERAVKNKIYHKMTYDPLDPLKKTGGSYSGIQMDMPEGIPDGIPERPRAKHPFITLALAAFSIYCDYIVIKSFSVDGSFRILPLITSIACILAIFAVRGRKDED